jgi:hypothetical protein
MNVFERTNRLVRIAEIANEILAETGEYGSHHVDPKVVDAVDKARREEYYERTERSLVTRKGIDRFKAFLATAPLALAESVRRGR